MHKLKNKHMEAELKYETSKLLKEKGFDIVTEKRYFFNSELTTKTQSQSSKPTIYAPTISQVVVWLYEKHGFWIYTTPHINMKGDFYWSWYVLKLNELSPKSASNIRRSPLFTSKFESPREAYEDAINFVLEKI